MTNRAVVVSLLLAATIGWGINADELKISLQGQVVELNGEILAKKDGGVLFLTPDGRLWISQPDEILRIVDSEQALEPLAQEEIAAKLLEELPEGFRIHETEHFVIAYNTERAYAKWVGGLYERLYRGFMTYWSRKHKYKLSAPKFPLAAIIFSNRSEYAAYMARELNLQQGAPIAYYNLLSNRVVMYDLTEGQRLSNQPLDNDRRIYEVLSNPKSIPMVATIIHEGTHQLMFNSGMQTRMSDTPLWINEGLAMFFETPDMSNSRGWRAIGQINPERLNHFLRKLPDRAPDAIERMIRTSDQFHDSATALDSYAEAWALNYYLLNKRSEDYVKYLKHMAQKPHLKYDDEETRLREFKQFLGEDLAALNREYLEYIVNQR